MKRSWGDSRTAWQCVCICVFFRRIEVGSWAMWVRRAHKYLLLYCVNIILDFFYLEFCRRRVFPWRWGNLCYQSMWCFPPYGCLSSIDVSETAAFGFVLLFDVQVFSFADEFPCVGASGMIVWCFVDAPRCRRAWSPCIGDDMSRATVGGVPQFSQAPNLRSCVTHPKTEIDKNCSPTRWTILYARQTPNKMVKHNWDCNAIG